MIDFPSYYRTWKKKPRQSVNCNESMRITQAGDTTNKEEPMCDNYLLRCVMWDKYFLLTVHSRSKSKNVETVEIISRQKTVS